LTLRVGGQHFALQDKDGATGFLCPDDKFSTLYRTVEIRGIDRKPPWLAAEGLDNAFKQIKPRIFPLIFRNVHQTHGSILMQAQNGFVHQVQRSTAVLADPNRVALAKPNFEAGRLPFTALIALHIDAALNGAKPAHRILTGLTG
jgi:hypothetical protein